MGAAALEGGGDGGDDDAPLTIEQFRGWYAAYLAEARHVGAPHWRPVLLMMARHGLLRVAGAKKKGSFDGWAARRRSSRPPPSRSNSVDDSTPGEFRGPKRQQPR